MTTTSGSSFIDYNAFGVSEDDLTSLQALAPMWQRVLPQVADGLRTDGAMAEFVARSAELPMKIADDGWQQAWMHVWHKLSGRGFSLSEMFAFFNSAIAACEAELFADNRPVTRLQLDLFSTLRRCVVAAVSCAIELGEEARQLESGLPGEFAAMRKLRELLADGRSAALLSVALDSHRALLQLTSGELQSLPGVLSSQLAHVLRQQDLVYRGREGEWLLVLPDILSMAQPVLAATQVRRAFKDPLVLISGRGLMLEVTIGAAMLPDHGDEAPEIIQSARLARSSLRSVDEPFAMFDVQMRQAWQQRHQLAQALREAMRQERLQLYLQPQVDLAEGRCFGAELLLRWQTDNGDWIPPPQIMEVVEENGWRSLYTDWLIRAALRMSVELEAAGIEISLSLNLTAGDLLDPDLPEIVRQCLATWHIPGNRFTFELTESAMMTNHERGLSVMQRLREQGIRLALDDFGTGFSSLSYLVTLPLNEIKIDRSFVVAMTKSPEGGRVVRAIIDLTRDLGMRSLAEGVEDAAQRDQLLALGCKDAQGYLYARPMPPAEFMAWYASRMA